MKTIVIIILAALLVCSAIISSAAIAGEPVSVTISLAEVPAELSVNQSYALDNFAQYFWEVLVDTDNNPATGDADGFDVSFSIGYFIRPGSTPAHVLFSALQANTWQLSPSSGSYGHKLTIAADQVTDTLTLTGDSAWQELQGITEDSRIYVRSYHWAEQGLLQDITAEGYGSVTDDHGDATNPVDIIGGRINLNPTVITLSSFTATPGSWKVTVNWETGSEINTAGFNLYRAESENGSYVTINNVLIAGKGSAAQGASYTYTDIGLQNRKTYYYKLEEVEITGKKQSHGPINCEPRLFALFDFNNKSFTKELSVQSIPAPDIVYRRGLNFDESAGVYREYIWQHCPQYDACQEINNCVDTDHDGFCDEWESSGYINAAGISGDNSCVDVQLPDADPNKPDVYVQYDWMGWSPPGNACDTTADCMTSGPAHTGETCSGSQVIPTKAGSCVYTCDVDADCTTRADHHEHERCISNVCQHTHDPELLAPGALQAVADSFADHGINLHIIRGHEQPHSIVTSFRRNNEMQDNCEGGSTYSGSAGVGKYAVSLYDLKAASALDKLNIAYHYGFFSHFAACDSTAHCGACPSATNPDGSPKGVPLAGESGQAEISGNDFIVSLGNFFQDSGFEPGIFNIGTTFMHELGHNLGIHHGGGIDTLCTTDADCPLHVTCTATTAGKYCLGQSDDYPYKTNYLSIMNYSHQWTGIIPAAPDESNSPITCESDADCPARNYCNLTSPPGYCARLDFSNEALPTGGNTPGVLDQKNMSEQAGLGSLLAPDLFYFTDLLGGLEGAIQSAARTVGPVDWDGDGNYDNDHVMADTRCGIEYGCDTPQIIPLHGWADWGPAASYKFNYKFQCTSFGGPFGDGAAAPARVIQHELNTQMAKDAHVLYHPRSVDIAINIGMQANASADEKHLSLSGNPGVIFVTLPGTDDFDVSEVDQTSITVRGTAPLQIVTQDVNNDGRDDLLIAFNLFDLNLKPAAKKITLSGWLKNSQVFNGQAAITNIDDDVRKRKTNNLSLR